MKHLLLVRHGKSEWGNAHLQDFDRPLNPRGHRDAIEMAIRLQQKDLVPQVLISSPALRAITTADHFAQLWEKPAGQMKQEEKIYEADITGLLEVVNHLSNNLHRAAIFGHNPGFTDFANYLSNGNIYNIPTCGIVLLEFQTDDWAEIGKGTGTLIDFDYPKNLEDD